jgi:MarR family transcriptional regulator, organic hydroperoxide resistance regulator
LAIVHIDAYYPRVSEPFSTVLPSPVVTSPTPIRAHVPPTDDELTAAATELLGIFRVASRQVPPVPASDLTMGQIRLLFLLRREGPQPMGRLAELFDLSPTASSGFVARVERHGLVVRHHRSDDRRIVECELTDAGLKLLQELSGDRLDTVRVALTALEPAELAEFRRLLRLISEGQEGLA